MIVVVSPDGRSRAIYDEALDLAALGALSIRRASHVEPDPNGHWWADLRPVDGPVLGPFRQRSAALAAEVEWLQTHWLEQPVGIPD